VKPARLVSEEIEVAVTRVATRQIVSTTNRMRRRKSSGGDPLDSHTVREPDTLCTRSRSRERPPWVASTSLPRWRRSFDLARRVADETIYKAMKKPLRLRTNRSREHDARPVAARLMPGAHFLLARSRDAAPRSTCERRPSTPPVGRRAPQTSCTSRRRRTYQRPHAKHNEPRPRTSTTRRLLRGSCPAHIGCSSVRVMPHSICDRSTSTPPWDVERRRRPAGRVADELIKCPTRNTTNRDREHQQTSTPPVVARLTRCAHRSIDGPTDAAPRSTYDRSTSPPPWDVVDRCALATIVRSASPPHFRPGTPTRTARAAVWA